MANSNPPFDEFLDMEQLDTINTDMFSFYFHNDGLSATPLDLSDLGSLGNLDITIDPVTTPESGTSDATIATDNTDTKKQERDIQLLLATNRQLQLQLQQQQLLNQLHQEKEKTRQIVATDTATTTSIDNSAIVAQLISASTPAALPQTVVPAVTLETPTAPQALPTALESSAVPITTAAAAADAQIAVLIDISKTAAAASAAAATAINSPATPVTTAAASAPTSTSAKRPSPEPIPAAKKIAKTEATSAKRSLPAPSLANPSGTAASTVPVASPINTTLSAATLQFLLQQQMQTPLVPQLFTGKLTREEIEETLARLLDSTRHLLLASQESVDKEESPPVESDEEADEETYAEKSSDQRAGHTHGLKTQPGIKTDDIPSSSDLKKMTSRERRQLRNKISARNFRVRRKEYIGQLEEQVEQHKTEARHLREAVTIVHEENKRLREELEDAKRQLSQGVVASASATISPQQSISTPSTTLSSENQSLLTSILTRSAFNANGKSNVTLTMPRAQSPILKPNLNKDIPNSSSISGSSWRDKNPVFIHTTLVPEIFVGSQFQFGQKAAWSKEDDMWDRPWLNMERTPKALARLEKNPFLVSGVVCELMQTFAAVSLGTMSLPEIENLSSALIQDETRATVQDYENDKRTWEALEWQMQQDLWVRVQEMANVSRKIDPVRDGLPEEVFQMLFGSSLTATSSTPSSCPFQLVPTFAQEDPNMLEWLYESMVARIVDVDLQGCLDQQTCLPFSEVQYA